MIDCCESNSLIEICGKLNKANTEIRFRCVIFRSFDPQELFKLKPFSDFFYY